MISTLECESSGIGATFIMLDNSRDLDGGGGRRGAAGTG